MKQPTAFLNNFRDLKIEHHVSQNQGLQWLIDSLQRSQGLAKPGVAEAVALYEQFQQSDHVKSRASVLADYTHQKWDQMSLYSQALWKEKWASPPLEARMQIFREQAWRLAGQAFSDDTKAPDYLLQVSCTGYDSPTAAQKIIHHKGWGKQTKTAHLGHMGCYAALPAANLAAELASHSRNENVSLFVIELCSLHLDPAGSQLQQVVMNTLFADGAIRFDVSQDKQPQSLAQLAYFETIIDDSEGEMTWSLKDSAFAMTLSRAVPILIARNVEGLLNEFLSPLGLRKEDIAFFAIHPGGPKIIELITERLELDPAKSAHSRDVFRRRGNMSSCTVPHIWQALLNDPAVPTGSLIVSMAFGPGLTVAANLLRKEA